MGANVVKTTTKATIYMNLFKWFRLGFNLFYLAFLFRSKINFSLVKRIIEFYIFV